MIQRCMDSNDEILYGIDCIKNVCCIYFTHDPRVLRRPSMFTDDDPEEITVIDRTNIFDYYSSKFN